MVRLFESEEKIKGMISNESNIIEESRLSWSIGRITKRERNTLRYIFYGFLYKLQHRDKSNKNSQPFMSQLKFSGWKLIISLQLSSIPWIQFFFYHKNSAFLDIFTLFLNFSIFIIWIYFLDLLAIYFLQKTSKIILLLLRTEKILRIIIFRVGYIPIAYSLAVTLKYLFFSSNLEYIEHHNWILNKNSDDFIGIYIITAFVLIVFACFQEFYIYEFRHSHYPNELMSKAHSKSEKIKLIGIHIILLTVMLSETSNVFYLKFTIFVVSFYITCIYIYYIPYFRLSFNFLEASSTLAAALISIEFMIDDAQTGFFLLIFVNPFILWFLYFICKYRASHIKPFYLKKQNTNLYGFERAYRKNLLDKCFSEDLLNIFDSALGNLKLQRSKMLAIWEADYCLSTLNDYKLASIKISTCYSLENCSLEEGFLEYCLRKEILKNLYKTDEEIKFLLCLEKLENWKKVDEEFCVDLIDSINLIHKQKYGISTTFSSIQMVYQKFIQMKNTHKEIKSNFQGISLSNNFFIKDNFKNMMVAENKWGYNLDDFQENNGMIIASGMKKNIGIILYANSKASSILREPTTSIIDSDINEYIPKNFDFDHSNLMKKYLRNCFSSEVNHPYNSVLKTKSGLAIEINMSVKWLSFEKHPFFLFLFQECYKSSKRLIDQQYESIWCVDYISRVQSSESEKPAPTDNNNEKIMIKEETIFRPSKTELQDSKIVSSKHKLVYPKPPQKAPKNLSQEHSSYHSSSLANSFLWEKYLPKIKKEYLLYRLFLFLSILTIVCTNATILAYTLTEISKAKNIDSLKETGLIFDSMIAISANAMKLDYSTYSNATSLTRAQGNDLINSLLLKLKLMTKDMLSQVPSWNYCPKFSFYTKNEIPMWETTGTYRIVYKNLVDMIYGYEIFASEFLKNYNNNLTYVNELSYLLLNSYGIIATRSNFLMDTLVSCEKYRAENLTTIISWLITGANIILIFCACIIIFIIFRICYNYRRFYEQAIKRLVTSYKNLHSKLATRLINTHNYEPININNLWRSKPLKRWYTMIF